MQTTCTKGFQGPFGHPAGRETSRGLPWKLIRTLTDYEYNFISALEEQRAIKRLQQIMAEQNAEDRNDD